MKIVTVAQMRALEAAAFASGASERELQERAGRAVAREVASLLRPGDAVAVVVGPGNNGRDGAVAAGALAARGIAVNMYLAPRHGLTADELDVLRSSGVGVHPAIPARLPAALAGSRVIVDGLLGIGARGPLRPPLAELARAVNLASAQRSGSQVVAIDLPSGVDADSGAVPGEAIWADRTVCLGAVKAGLLRFPAAERVGQLTTAPIGLPAEALDPLPFALLDEAGAGGDLPARPLAAHKYRLGRVLVAGGSDTYRGAPLLAAAAAARSGAGLVSLAVPDALRASATTLLPEATYEDDDSDALLARLPSYQALVIGPGLGRSPAAFDLVRRTLLAERGGPAVVDGDALAALAAWPEWWREVRGEVLLTPHAGELARLVGEGADDRPPWAAAAEHARHWGCVVVAKGPFTTVAGPDGRASVWPRANAALATAGSGDVLAGLIGGLLAQGAGSTASARLGVVVHATAAAAIVAERSWGTLLASDLLYEIPRRLAALAPVGGARRLRSAAPKNDG